MAGQGSARVTLREIDLSQVKNPQQLPQGVPAAVVGPARKGPAFVPRTFANMQQFNEVFGNMIEVGREGNSNLYGPLALNEWMKSAQAGTYIRILGVGDGKATSAGKVAGAGFVVGEKQLQDQSSGVAKVGNNIHAKADGSGNLSLGRTHMLGCFMKDSAGSNYLKDSGVESEENAGSIVIVAKAIPEAGDSITINALEEVSAQFTEDKTITFTASTNDANSVALDEEVTALAAYTDFRTKLLALADSNVGTLADHLNITVTEAPAGTVTVTITNKNDALGEETNDSKVKFNMTSDVTVGTKTESSIDDKFSYALEGGSSAKIDVTITAQPANGSSLELIGLRNDKAGAVSAGAEETVTYTFQSAAILATAEEADGIANRYQVTAANTVTIYSGGSLANTIANLKAAIDRTLTTTHALKHKGLFTTKLSNNDLTLTVSHVNKGVKGNGSGAAFNAANVTLAGVSNLSIDVADSADGAQNITITDNADTGFFYGGVDGTAISFTMTLTDNLNDNDYLTIPMLDNDAANASVFENFVFEANGNNGTLRQNGGDSGDALTFVGATRNPEFNFISVQIGDDKQETLYNFRRALEATASIHTQSDIKAIVSDETNSITLTLNDGANNNVLLDGVQEVTVNVSDAATFSNTDNETLRGNYGEKTENFTGGGGTAAPIIRGVLMTPQGVVPALNVNDALTDFVSVTDSSENERRSASNGKSFGSNAATDLTGYTVGEVDTTAQGFKIILNGYTNEENPEVLSCSFDPSSPSYFAKVLNTDPTKIEELGHYLYSHWDIESSVAAPSNVGLRHAGGQISVNYVNMTGFLVAGEGDGVTKRNTSAAGKPNYEDFSERFATAKTPWIVSQFYGVGANDAARPKSISAADGDAKKLFRLHSLDDGAVSNSQFRLLISNLRYNGLSDYGTFNLSLETFDSDPIKGNVIATWKNANLNPDSGNFIGRLIGDKHVYYDFDRDVSKQRLKETGKYDLKNSFVRIELSDDLKQGQVPITALPTGFQGHSYLFTNGTDNFLEQTGLGSNRIFTASDDAPLSVLSRAQVAPLDFVTSINRTVGGAAEADDDLAWGVKMSVRENASSSDKELVEQVFNRSISSWTKFFPSDASNPAWITDGASSDLNQNSFFSLEKIAIPAASLDSGVITSWDGATYKRSATASPSGKFVTISQDATGGNYKYLKFRCLFQGGFDGVNIFDEQKSEFTGIASLREGEDETGTQKFTGPTIMAYQRAIDVLADKSAVEFQLLAVPGQRTPRVTDYAINACETRFDALFVMDIAEKDAVDSLIEDSSTKPHVRNTISLFSNRVLDTSFAAAYFPDVVVRRPSDNAPIVVPPSVGMLGVMSRNDSIADPWFAPAGLNRGKLSAIDSRVQMNRDLLDELYDADINPIYVPAGRSGEVYAFGQKTLLQDASALDRINVRRLLIDLRRKVKKVGEKLLFEPNRASTLSRFSSLVEPIMSNVQQRRGVTRYKVQIDSSTTTQNDIENNTIRGKIYLQPTKSVEFISLDFVVTNTIQQ